MSSGGLVSCTSQVVLSGTGHHAFAIEARLHQGAQAGKDKGVRRLDDPVSLCGSTADRELGGRGVTEAQP